MTVIGRDFEKKKLTEIVESEQPAFVAIYGRRRVGKTYLVKEFFDNKFAFYATGLANGDTKTQLLNFTIYINQSFGTDYKTPKTWLETFH